MGCETVFVKTRRKRERGREGETADEDVGGLMSQGVREQGRKGGRKRKEETTGRRERRPQRKTGREFYHLKNEMKTLNL